MGHGYGSGLLKMAMGFICRKWRWEMGLEAAEKLRREKAVAFLPETALCLHSVYSHHSRSRLRYQCQQREEALVMEMDMQMKSYLKDSNVGIVIGVVTPIDSNVGVGVGIVTPNGTANHEHAAQPLLKLWIAALFLLHINLWKCIYGCAVERSWEMNKIDTTEHAIPTRYYCYRCRHLVTMDAEVEIKCLFCQDGFIQACEGVNSCYGPMPAASSGRKES